MRFQAVIVFVVLMVVAAACERKETSTPSTSVAKEMPASSGSGAAKTWTKDDAAASARNLTNNMMNAAWYAEWKQKNPDQAPKVAVLQFKDCANGDVALHELARNVEELLKLQVTVVSAPDTLASYMNDFNCDMPDRRKLPADFTKADFLLIGRVKKSEKQMGEKIRLTYRTFADLVDVKSNRQIWTSFTTIRRMY